LFVYLEFGFGYKKQKPNNYKEYVRSESDVGHRCAQTNLPFLQGEEVEFGAAIIKKAFCFLFF